MVGNTVERLLEIRSIARWIASFVTDPGVGVGVASGTLSGVGTGVGIGVAAEASEMIVTGPSKGSSAWIISPGMCVSPPICFSLFIAVMGFPIKVPGCAPV